MVFLMTLRRMGLDVTAHGFRSRSGTGRPSARPSRARCASLAHSQRDKTEAAYRRGDLIDKRRALMGHGRRTLQRQ